MADQWNYQDPSLARSAAIRAALLYWREKAGAAAMPARRQIDPIEMRGFVAKLLLIDVEADGGFVYRLCGTAVAGLNQRELTGRRADADSLGASAAQFIHSYRRAVAERQPVFFAAEMWWQGREYVRFEQINLPLSSDGAAVDKLMCVIDTDLPKGG